MELKQILSLLGLAMDLTGAFLLSIPMVWDVEAAYKSLDKSINLLQENIKDFLVSGSLLRHPVLFLLEAVPGLLLIVYIAANWTKSYLDILKAIIALSAYHLIYIAIYLLSLLALIFLKRIAHEKLERKVGIIGLVILMLGFITQAFVNFL